MLTDLDTLRLRFEASERESEHGFNLHKYGIGYADEATQARWEAWIACRAAMLQGADGNSPVIPDGWVACSERMPDETQPVITVSEGGVVQRTVYQFCEGVWSDWYDLYEDVSADSFTHWMPLPAAPQQEVTVDLNYI